MTIEYDEKGKYFTNVIQKVPVPSVIQTASGLVRGFVHVRQNERLKDELENDERFLAVTDATVSSPAGEVIFSGPFMVVQKEQIVWIMPLADEQTGNSNS
ncbi:MAG: hypothetical protein IPG44_19150 [Anaerolineales bacterium]|jgi:hypothetical protein|nr:hypothetical protein [Chloroflexota bacterium]MBK6647831.1 hypothetical protein [Anaerolineales bacterium]MCC6985429.1 hypothetical protein [Anaerolineales bacterium]